MYRTRDDLHQAVGDWIRWGLKGYRDMSVEDAARRYARRLESVLVELKALPFASEMLVFGSALEDGFPGDVDVFLDLSRVDPSVSASRDLMVLARKHFPLLDPFVLARDGSLFCRSESDEGAWLTWTKARFGRDLTQAGRAGVPLLSFEPEWTARLEAHALPQP